MHEVLAPFVALSDPELSTSDISLCYGAFIKRFLPYAFNKDEEFLSLQVRTRYFVGDYHLDEQGGRVQYPIFFCGSHLDGLSISLVNAFTLGDLVEGTRIT